MKYIETIYRDGAPPAAWFEIEHKKKENEENGVFDAISNIQQHSNNEWSMASRTPTTVAVALEAHQICVRFFFAFHKILIHNVRSCAVCRTINVWSFCNRNFDCVHTTASIGNGQPIDMAKNRFIGFMQITISSLPAFFFFLFVFYCSRFCFLFAHSKCREIQSYYAHMVCLYIIFAHKIISLYYFDSFYFSLVPLGKFQKMTTLQLLK